MGSFAADQLVRDVAGIQSESAQAAIAGAEDGLLMTIGITPTHPETGYGYLHVGEPTGDGRRLQGRRVRGEAVGSTSPRRTSSPGEYLWNAGMFVWRVDVFLDELARQQPDPARRPAPHRRGLGHPRTARRSSAEIWPDLTKISVDFGVMEGAAAPGLVGTVPGDFGWNDVGDFHTLGELLETDAAGNVVVNLDPATPAERAHAGRTERVVVVRSRAAWSPASASRPDHRRHAGRAAGLPPRPGPGRQEAGRQPEGTRLDRAALDPPHARPRPRRVLPTGDRRTGPVAPLTRFVLRPRFRDRRRRGASDDQTVTPDASVPAQGRRLPGRCFSEAVAPLGLPPSGEPDGDLVDHWAR